MALHLPLKIYSYKLLVNINKNKIRNICHHSINMSNKIKRSRFNGSIFILPPKFCCILLANGPQNFSSFFFTKTGNLRSIYCYLSFSVPFRGRRQPMTLFVPIVLLQGGSSVTAGGGGASDTTLPHLAQCTNRNHHSALDIKKGPAHVSPRTLSSYIRSSMQGPPPPSLRDHRGETKLGRLSPAVDRGRQMV